MGGRLEVLCGYRGRGLGSERKKWIATLNTENTQRALFYPSIIFHIILSLSRNRSEQKQTKANQ